MSDRGTVHRLQTFGLWLAVAVCLGISIFPILAPRAPTGDDPGAISVDLALEHVAFIAQEHHVMGTPEIERVREYLIETLTGVGLEPETLTVETPDYFGAPGGTVDVTDVLVRIPGSGDGEAILFMAHYDTVPSTPGANDNSTAVAALLEVGRVLAAGPSPPNDVILLFTDGEEPTPRFGAWGFAEYYPWFDDVVLAVNLEGIGVAGPTMLVEMSGPKGELISRLANAVPDLVAFSFMTQTADLIGGAASDFDVFRDAGVPGYNFAYMRGMSIYHTPRDAIDVVNVNGLAHDISLSLGIARNFGSPEIGNATNDAVFFTVPFGFVVRYSTIGAIVSLVAALLLLAGALRSRVTRRGSSVRGLLSGFGLALLGALIVLVIATVVWAGLVNLRSDMGMVEGYAYLAALVGLTGGAWYLVERRSAKSGSDTVGGLLIVWLVLALLTGVFLP
ncbi:MAG: M20/M25/M40 family metallo-hydrolase, partial [Acidimicrobiia bacterium]|nr:M20/M25/M40 family metallo-hydrolase [Acidimicrobiia bacterium]